MWLDFMVTHFRGAEEDTGGHRGHVVIRWCFHDQEQQCDHSLGPALLRLRMLLGCFGMGMTQDAAMWLDPTLYSHLL